MEDNAAYSHLLRFFGVKEQGDGVVFSTVVERVGYIFINIQHTQFNVLLN